MKIVACMIVRDEEPRLARCIERFKPLVDGILVYDTGSKDKTIEVAEQCGAVVIRGEWEDSFSRARNLALYHLGEQFPNTDWVLVVDADELLEVEEGVSSDMIRHVLSNATQDCVAVPWWDYKGDDCRLKTYAHRILRYGKVHYEGAVHNEAIFEGDAVLLPFIVWRHYGYDLDEATMQKKHARRVQMLTKQLVEDPSKQVKSLFYLCQTYGMNGDTELCLAYGQKYLRACEESGEQIDTTIIYTMAATLQLLGKFEESLPLIQRGLDLCPNQPDLSVLLSEVGRHCNDWRLVAEGARSYCDARGLLAQNSLHFGNMFLYTINDATHALQLTRLCSIALQESMIAFDSLKAEYLPNLSDELLDILRLLFVKYKMTEQEQAVPNSRDNVSFGFDQEAVEQSNG